MDYSSPVSRDLVSPRAAPGPAQEGASHQAAPEKARRPPLRLVQDHQETKTPDPVVDPSLTVPEVSCRMVTGFIEYFRERQGPAFVDGVISAAGLPLEYLQVDRWVSRAYVERFVNEAVSRLGVTEQSPDYLHPVWQHWRKVGARTLKPHLIGNIHTVLRALGSPGSFYRHVPKLIHNSNHVLDAKLMESGPGVTVLEFSALNPALPDTPWGCWNRVGLFEGAPAIWGLLNARIEHQDCMHHPTHPAKSCVYRIHYQDRTLVRFAPTLGFAALGALAMALLAPIFAAPFAWLAITGACAGIAWDGWRRNRSSERTAVQDGNRMAEFVDDSDRRYVTLWKDRQSLRRALDTNRRFSGYLNRGLVAQILEEPERELRLEGQRTLAAVLFGDIVGFTRRCEKLTPEAAVEDLNTWFAHVDPIIHAHGGIIDKRIGDAVMVLFVARENEDPSNEELWNRAIRCGLAMQLAMRECRRALAHRKADDMELRVGIAGGSLVQGTMGSPERYEYTVIGDVVNIAAHLESHATPNRVLVLSEMLSEFCPGKITSRQTIRVKGRQTPIEVTELAPDPGGFSSQPETAPT